MRRLLAGTGRTEMLYFMLHSFSLGCWVVRLPDVQTRLGLDKAQLATALLGMPAGVVVALLIGNAAIRRFGIKRVWVGGHLLLHANWVLLGYSPTPALLALGMLIMGFSLLTSQVALNIQADCIERATGTLIMSRCHGFFMLGLLLGSLAGVATATLAMSTGTALLLCALAMGPAGALVVGAAPRHSPLASKLGRGPGRPPPGFAGVACYVLGAAIAEGAMGVWATLYLREYIGSPHPLAGLGFALFTVLFCIGRFAGDRLKARFGAVAVARATGVVAIGAVTLIVLPPSLVGLVAGYGLLGIGIAFSFPFAVTAAAALSAEPAANTTWLVSVSMFGFQFGPVLLGYVAEIFSLQAALGLLVPLLVLSLAATGHLRLRQPVAG